MCGFSLLPHHLSWVLQSPGFYQINKPCLLFVGLVFLVVGEINTLETVLMKMGNRNMFGIGVVLALGFCLLACCF